MPLVHSLIVVLFIFVTNSYAVAGPDTSLEQQVNDILDAPTPAGVVFEVIMDEDGLRNAIPHIRKYSEQLRTRFPDLPLAVVTHGSEQFALLQQAQGEYRQVHQGVKSLLSDNVNVHVCGTHAGWRGHSDEDFPDYVDVAASGPAQINDYVALGYIKVLISSSDQALQP